MDNIKKIYWTIGELANELDILPSNLRFWEKQFHWIVVKKNKKGHRQYTSINKHQFLDVQILSVGGLTLEGIRRAYECLYYKDSIEFFKDKEDKQLKLELC